MKNYFNYGAPNSSKELTEAIASIKGVGPILGFNSASITNSQGVYSITLNSLPTISDPMYGKMLGEYKRWNIKKSPTDSEGDQDKFVCIARDGTLFTSDSNTITIPIQGSRASYNEVIVFAFHTPNVEPINNPVNFIAYWSENTESSFYDFYQKANDPQGIDGSYTTNPGLDNDINYNSLESLVEDSCTFYSTNKSSMVLIGIYGIYNGDTFNIVPYNGAYPNELGYTTAIHSSISKSLQRFEHILKGYNSPLEEILNTLKQELVKSMTDQIILNTLPIGSIILWEGDNIPQGWEEYTNAAGRVVVGHSGGGITIPSSKTGSGTNKILSKVGSTYDPDGNWSVNLEGNDLPSHYHRCGLTKSDSEDVDTGSETRVVESNYDDRNTSLNGQVGKVPVKNITNGSLLTSKNLIGNSTTEVSNTSTNINIMPPAVTLKYIRKVQSTPIITEL